MLPISGRCGVSTAEDGAVSPVRASLRLSLFALAAAGCSSTGRAVVDERRAFGLSEIDAVRYYVALKMAERGLVSAPNMAIGAPFNVGLTGTSAGMGSASITPAGVPAV